MKKVFVTFGGSPYERTTQAIVERATQLGADEVRVYDDLWLTTQDFYKQNQWIWEYHDKVGFGWHCWKSYIVMHALDRLNDGDMVLYVDADTYPIHNFSVLFDTCAKDGGGMFFEASQWMNLQWCKRDCYKVLGQDEDRYWNSKAGCARFFLVQKGPWKPRQLLMEWMTYKLNPLANTRRPSELGEELPGFREHRTDQGILTLLVHKFGYKMYREMCQSGEAFSNDKDLYPTLFIQDTSPRQYLNKTAPIAGSKFFNIEPRVTA